MANERATHVAEPYGTELDEPRRLVDFSQILRKLYPRRLLIGGFVIGCGLLGTGIAYILPNVYTSTASFIPPSLNPSGSMANAIAGQLSAMSTGGLLGAVKNSGDLYAGILMSRSIADDLIQRFHLLQIYGVPKESQAEKILHSHTSIEVDTKTSIVTVSVTEKDPARARDLTAAYMGALSDAEGRLALSQSSQRRLFFGEQLAKEKDALENAEVALKKTEEQSGLIAPTGQTEAEIRTIADTQAQIALRQVELAALRQAATEQNPDVIRLRSEIADLDSQLAKMQHGTGNRPGLTIPTSQVPELQLDYVRKEREVKYHEALFDMLSKQYEAARLDEARDAPVLQMLDPASFPDSKSGPRRMAYAAIGLSTGLMLGCVWVLIGEALRRYFGSLRLS